MEASCLGGWILPHPPPKFGLAGSSFPQLTLVFTAPGQLLSQDFPAFCLHFLNPNFFWEAAQGDGSVLVSHRIVDAASVQGHSMNLKLVAEANRCICFFALITVIKYLA